MGLMTDGLHDQIKIMVDLMAAVAKGQVSPQTLGRWVATYHQDRREQLPADMQCPLSESEIEEVHATLRAAEEEERGRRALEGLVEDSRGPNGADVN